MKNAWKNNEDKIICCYYPNASKIKIMNMLPNRSWAAIQAKASKTNIKRNYVRARTSDALSKLLHESPETYYWMGFFLADAHFSDRSLVLEISSKDKNVFENISAFLEFSVPLYNRKRNNGIQMRINDTYNMAKIKNKFHVQSNKTKNPPIFSQYESDNKNIFSMLVGFIDGDGNIRKVAKRSSQITLECDYCWRENLLYIETFLYEYFEITPKKFYTRINNRKNSILSLSRHMLNVLIFNEAERLKLPILYRKWNNIIRQGLSY